MRQILRDMSTSAITPAKKYLSPRECHEEGNIRIQSILAWIASGELPATNVATDRNGKRPTWRIARSDWDLFLASRRAVQAPPPLKPRRRTEPAAVKYFAEQ